MLKGALGKLIGGGGGSGDDTSFNLTTPYGRLGAFFHEIDQTTVARRLTLSIGINGAAQRPMVSREKKTCRRLGQPRAKTYFGPRKNTRRAIHRSR